MCSYCDVLWWPSWGLESPTSVFRYFYMHGFSARIVAWVTLLLCKQEIGFSLFLVYKLCSSKPHFNWWEVRSHCWALALRMPRGCDQLLLALPQAVLWHCATWPHSAEKLDANQLKIKPGACSSRGWGWWVSELALRGSISEFASFSQYIKNFFLTSKKF